MMKKLATILTSMMSKKVTLTGMVVLIVLFGLFPASYVGAVGEGWLTGWDYRKSVTLSRAAGAVSDYQMLLEVFGASGNDSGNTVYLNGKSQGEDLGDIRFTQPDGSTLLDYWVEDEVLFEKGAGISDFNTPIGFIRNGSFYANGVTYIPYVALTGADVNKIKIFTYTHSTGVVSSPVVVSTVPTNPDYSRPCIVVDTSGYIHIFFGNASQTAQGSQLNHRVSNNPYDISAWSNGNVPASTDHVVSPNVLIDSDGSIYLIYSYMPSTTQVQIMIRKSVDNGANWTNPISGALIDFGNNIWLWPSVTWMDESDKIHICFIQSVQGTETMTDIFYICGSSSGTVWKKADNTTISPPATSITADLAWDTSVRTEANDVRLDPSGYPFILASSKGASYMEWSLVKWTGVAWSVLSVESENSGDANEGWGTLDVSNADNVTVYLQYAGGGRIGDLVEWATVNGGTNWSEVRTICDGEAYGQPIQVVNGVPALKMFWYGPDYGVYFFGSHFVKADIWVEFNSIGTGATTFYLYYGNASAASCSNAANTFILFDDFERGADGDPIGGSWTVAQGSLLISTDHPFKGTRCVKLVGGAAVPIANIPLTASDNQRISVRHWREDHNKDGGYLQHGDGSKLLDILVDGFENISYYDGAVQDTGVDATVEVWELFEVTELQFAAGTFDIWHKEIKIKDNATMWTDATATNTLQIVAAGAATEDIYMDEFIVRKWADPEPAWGTWGSEEERETATPAVITQAVTSVEETTATLSANITAINDSSIPMRGFVWDTVSHINPGNVAPSNTDYAFNWTESDSYGIGEYNYGVTGLDEGELYYVRGCAKNNNDFWGYGSEVKFLTKPDRPLNLVATPGNEQVDLVWTKGGGATYTIIRGKIGGYPTNYDTDVGIYSGVGSSTTHTGLTNGDHWYYRAWSKTTEGGETKYSDHYASADATPIGTPSVVTNDATDVAEASATLNATVTNTGNGSVDYRGFVWDTSSRSNPGNIAPTETDYENNWTEYGTYGTGDFAHGLTDLEAEVTHYFRGCARNTNGWGYGDERYFPIVGGLVLWFQFPINITTLIATPSDNFTDLSGLGHDATPTFRTDSSDADVSAEMASFEPIEEAQAPAWVLEAERDFWDTENITATGTFTTTPTPTAAPGVDIIVAISEASGTPAQLPFNVIAGFVILAASLTATWFLAKYGSRNIWLKIMFITILMAVCVAVKVFDFWMIVFFLIMAIAIALFSRQRSSV